MPVRNDSHAALNRAPHRLDRRTVLGLGLGLRLGLGGGVGQSWSAEPPERRPRLRRGINITNWFRYPPSTTPAALEAYLSAAAIADLRQAGFDFVRLPVAPTLIETDTAVSSVLEAIRRLQSAALAVIVDLHPTTQIGSTQHLPLEALWARLAPALATTDPAQTLLELVNEPVGSASAWAKRQQSVLFLIRSRLPFHTLVCSGTDWGSLAGLLAAAAPIGRNLLMSFHFYEPPALTMLAESWQPALRPALVGLPFPVAEGGVSCVASEAVGRSYCAAGWNVAQIAARVRLASTWSRRVGVPVVMGEFGIDARVNRPARLAWLAAVRQACEADQIPWALWGLDDVHGFDLPRPLPPKLSLDAGVSAALGLGRSN